MNINIELNEKYVALLLDMFDYTTEKVLVWYNKLDDECNVKELGSYYKTIAYESSKRPEVLNKEKIMLDDVKDYGLNNTVNKLFNELLMKKLFN